MNTSSHWQRNKRYNTDTGRVTSSFEEDKSEPNWLENIFYTHGQHFNSDNLIESPLPSDAIDDLNINKKVIYNAKRDQDIYKTNPVVINDNNNSNKIKQKERLILEERHPDIKQDKVDAFANQPNFIRFANVEINSNNISKNWQSEKIVDSKGKEFVLYELSNPDIWFNAQVQLLEKLSTSEGKTVWKDITQNAARITSSKPEWANQYLNIRYRSTEFVPMDDFSLPSTGICLLIAKNGGNGEERNKDNIDIDEFIIVPSEDIEIIQENRDHNRGKNSSIGSASSSGAQHHHPIMVRLSRALLVKNGDGYEIVNEGSDLFLRIPYRQSHHGQIDLEAQADDNQLVYVGSSGRLTTVVSENTRRTRAALTIQVTNTGLAAARFRPKIRECGLETMRTINEDEAGTLVDSVKIPPMHTHSFRIVLPMDRIGDGANCMVALLNDDDDSVAVREVRIKRGDRCFCVWHCQCVCLNEDPKLLCQELAEQLQVAAGLSPRERPRQVRAACYPNVVTINLLVIFTGVIFLLLVLGLLKAFLGLFFRCVGSWGINQMIQTPRRLDHYYERNLRDRAVVFDEDGWPVHPDTKKRTVRLISMSMEFVLNVIFFITMPFLVLYNSLNQIISHRKRDNDTGTDTKMNGNKCISSRDMQAKKDRWRVRRAYRKRGLCRWMTSHAEELSTDIWRNGLASQGLSHPECTRPLLHEQRYRGKMYELQTSVVDSEHDDTEYVLMQMQKSKESLTKTQHRHDPEVKD